ncbi:PREDICTED: PHD finger protein 21A-like isoform X2 [Priapulus caudatus]|uniref:PHD finger protein 21A-like isoform X2 n=1 Tax=Priapulus caudatus TaxID=37621 RepID=A0ABM1DWD1_PRICU|nr:PREDICTED: PHD finger protein 21A-like isoform X2 [Priapulus caudatus]
MELEAIQAKLKIAIQNHQTVVAKMKQGPVDSALQKRLHELQEEIMTLSENQKQIVQNLRKELVSKGIITTFPQPAKSPSPNPTATKPVVSAAVPLQAQSKNLFSRSPHLAACPANSRGARPPPAHTMAAGGATMHMIRVPHISIANRTPPPLVFQGHSDAQQLPTAWPQGSVRHQQLSAQLSASPKPSPQQSLHQLTSPQLYGGRQPSLQQSAHQLPSPQQSVHQLPSPQLSAHQLPSPQLSAHQLPSPPHQSACRQSPPQQSAHQLPSPQQSAHLQPSLQLSGHQLLSQQLYAQLKSLPKPAMHQRSSPQQSVRKQPSPHQSAQQKLSPQQSPHQIASTQQSGSKQSSPQLHAHQQSSPQQSATAHPKPSLQHLSQRRRSPQHVTRALPSPQQQLSHQQQQQQQQQHFADTLCQFASMSPKQRLPVATAKTAEQSCGNKEGFMAAIGLITQSALTELQARKLERKRRSTANPAYNYPFEPGKKVVKGYMLGSSPIASAFKRPRGRPPRMSSPHGSQPTTPDRDPSPVNGIDNSAFAYENGAATPTAAAAAAPSAATNHPPHETSCATCGRGGQLLPCDSCTKVYHLRCLDPPLSSAPRGMWACPKCKLMNRSSQPWTGTLAIVHSYIAHKAGKEEEKRKLLKRSVELKSERQQLELRAKQLTSQITVSGAL